MYKTVFTSIKAVFYSTVFILLSACQQGSVNVSQSSSGQGSKDSGPAKQQDEKEKEPKLTEESAESFLEKYARSNPADEAIIHTSKGDIRIKLYQNTPLHRANFVFLTRQGYFDDTWFHRVSKGHVIQAGNTDERATVKKREAIGDYDVPSELGAKNLHKKGAVAAARSYYQNPEKDSDPYEFYIVLGKTYSKAELRLLAEREDFKVSQRQLDYYSKNPGAPHLDQEHTVFGEVISGMDVVEKINQVETDEGEWPLTNIPIQVEIVE